MEKKHPAEALSECERVVLCGEVVGGKHLGHTLGFPTANQLFSDGEPVPGYGVYASTAEIDGKVYCAVSSVGTRPTVSGEGVRCETYVIGWTGDLYGRRIKTTLRAYLRDEKKFSSTEELCRAIEQDVARAVDYFESNGY